MKKHKPIRADNDWAIGDLEKTWEVIQEINETKYKIEHYPAKFELISFEGMLSAYSTVALPGLYDHWSFGKNYVEEEAKYRQTNNLAFEVVINSNPSICYLMDSNTYTTQALVIAHAAIGHSGFFKNNHMFKTHTKADTILPFLSRSSERIRQLEEKHGEELIEQIIDCCNTLKYNSFDTHPIKTLTTSELQAKKKEASEGVDSRIDKILDFSTANHSKILHADYMTKDDRFVEDIVFSHGTNILKFIQENSVNTTPVVREIIGIMLEINQYLYPQMHTQLMNEGFASFAHYHIMQDMYDAGYITEGQWWEFTQLHCSVLSQQGIMEGNSRINPYKLGFDMYKDIKRICLDPTAEDRIWFPDTAGNLDWVGEIKKAAYGYKDESFISQYLSPKVIRDYRMLSMSYDYAYETVTMTETHDVEGYNNIIINLSKQYDFFSKIPEFSAYTMSDQKELFCGRITLKDDRLLADTEASSVKMALEWLWAGDVHIAVGYMDKGGNYDAYDLD